MTLLEAIEARHSVRKYKDEPIPEEVHGVFGLQRGFKKAGVQSIVMSLWQVDDDATKVMMTRFYENLAKGKSKYDAFREAQNYLRKYVDEDGRTYDEPEYYAAFVLLDAIK